MRRSQSLWHFIVPLVVSLLSPAWGAEQNPSRAFGAGERLVYDIAYLGVSAGTGVMEVMAPSQVNGHMAYPVISTAQSNDLVSLFYPVSDRVESYMDVEGLHSHRIDVRQHQGKKRREKVVNFDPVRRVAVQRKNGKEEVFSVPSDVHDALSSLYFFRNQTFPGAGESVFINVHESEKNWKLEIRILGKERVATPVGTFDTVKVQALIRYRGIFLDSGDVFLWMSDDAHHIPVKIVSTIKIGAITATLISRRDAHTASAPSTAHRTPIVPLTHGAP